MYDFPRRVKQHKIETKALAIFMYHLRNCGGIIRDLRENDYGIDLEYEFVSGEHVVGRFLKIQLKGFDGIKSMEPRIHNLKQGTLNYWANVSYRVNTIVVGVDVASERIYFTFPVFWDAISQIDNTEKRKSISFVNLGSGSESAELADTNEAAAILIHHMALIPSIGELLLVHKNILARIGAILDFCSDCVYNDQFLEFEEFCELKRLLDDASVLLWRANIEKRFEGYNRTRSWHSLDFFRKNTRDGRLKYWDMRDKLNVIVVALLQELVSLRNKVIGSLCYWLCQDRDYLELVYKSNIAKLTGETIEEVVRKHASIGTAYLEKDYDEFVMMRISDLERKAPKTATPNKRA
jgi:hypothetical protein